MKILNFIVWVFCLLAMQSFANNLKLGVDYIVLEKPLKDSQNSVIELFNIGCPHCAYYNGLLPKILEMLPQDTKFLPYHLSTTARYHKEFSDIVVVALLKDKENKRDTKSPDALYKKVLDYYFNTIHRERRNWKNAQLFLENSYFLMNIDEQEFQQLLNSKEAKEILEAMPEAMEYASIQGVPSFIINGKYMIVSRNIKSIEDLIFKINVLLEE
ncbi:thiol:disulfide interchange protein DsbA/DsbL [Helicobacter mesocricetorum]|uniref:thiol:disulfide interchange protein DsbA/DsbL n=1 Tax=Helicobacter mesocricetorum TaxID=87012 RepID=UPI000CF18B84|nr:thiol:disulfide interchange protein DsbA/DsbL [Helicobacter mesocricetorum]